jgi:tetratricopeptide (TPR) repeat protein
MRLCKTTRTARLESAPGERRALHFPPSSRLPAAFGSIALVLFIAFTLHFRHQVPGVPVPSNLAALEPQLRDYITDQVNWVKKKPHSSDRQATLGLVYAANSLCPEASSAFSNAARLNPKEPLAQLYLAVAAEESDNLPEAARLLRGLTTRFPSFGPGFYRLGEVALRVGDLDQAEGAFERLTRLVPQEWRGYAGLGQVKLRRRDYDGAVPLLKKAIEIDPRAKSPHYLLGLACRGLGLLPEAKMELTVGQDHVDSPMPDAWSKQIPRHMRLLQDQVQLAHDLEEAGEADQAVVLLAKAFTYHPEDIGLINNLAIALNRAGHPKKAQILLESALQRNDRYLPAHITLSFSCQASRQFDRALAAADRAIALSPQTAQAHIAKANALLGMERDEAALAELDEALRCDPKNAEIQMEMGDVCWRNLNMPEAALKHYVAATNLNPALAPAYVRLGDYYLSQRDAQRAEPVIQILQRLAPDRPETPLLRKRWEKLHAPELPPTN